jgi:hypothetical protein
VSFNDLAHVLDAAVRVRAWPEAEDALLQTFPLLPDVGSRRTTNLLLGAAEHIHGARSGGSTLADAAEALREQLSTTRS